jgi:hypothetical protein
VAHSQGHLDPCHLQKNQPLLIYHLQTKLVMVRPHVLSVRVLFCPKFKVFQFRPCWMATHQVDTSESPWLCKEFYLFWNAGVGQTVELRTAVVWLQSQLVEYSQCKW